MENKELLTNSFIEYNRKKEMKWEKQQEEDYQRKLEAANVPIERRRKSSVFDTLPTASEALKKIWNLALFPIIAMVFHPLFQIVNSIYMGHYSDE